MLPSLARLMRPSRVGADAGAGSSSSSSVLAQGAPSSLPHLPDEIVELIFDKILDDDDVASVCEGVASWCAVHRRVLKCDDATWRKVIALFGFDEANIANAFGKPQNSSRPDLYWRRVMNVLCFEMRMLEKPKRLEWTKLVRDARAEDRSLNKRERYRLIEMLRDTKLVELLYLANTPAMH
jgi:hypothetical protein